MSRIIIALLLVLTLEGCGGGGGGGSATAPPPPTHGPLARLPVATVADLAQQAFPHLVNGQSLFLAEGEYWLFARQDIEQVLAGVASPPTRFKATQVLGAELQAAFDPLVAVGCARSDGSTPWALVVLAMDSPSSGTPTWYFYDPATKQRLVGFRPELLIM